MNRAERYLIILVFLFILITIVYWSADIENHPKIIGYINMLSILSTVAIILGLIITIQNNDNINSSFEKRQLELNRNQLKIAMLEHENK
jgi:Skp family chaperone for outer membrane proteins